MSMTKHNRTCEWTITSNWMKWWQMCGLFPEFLCYTAPIFWELTIIIIIIIWKAQIIRCLSMMTKILRLMLLLLVEIVTAALVLKVVVVTRPGWIMLFFLAYYSILLFLITVPIILNLPIILKITVSTRLPSPRFIFDLWIKNLPSPHNNYYQHVHKLHNTTA